MSEHKTNNIEQLTVIAESFGCDLIKGEIDELLLDIDDDAALQRYEAYKAFVHEFFQACEMDRWPSRSGTGIHIRMKMTRPLGVAERIALQACLGSDPKREIMALDEYVLSGTDTISLFKPKAVAE